MQLFAKSCLSACALLFLLTSFTWAAPAPAPEPTAAANLSQVPAETVLAVHLRGFEQSKARLLTLIKNAVPDLAGIAAPALDGQIEQMLMGRSLKAFPKDGSIFLAMLDFPENFFGADDVPACIVAQVTSFNEFRDTFLTDDERKAWTKDKAGFYHTKIQDKETYFIERKNWVVATPHKDTAEKLVKQEQGLNKVINKKVAEKLLQADLSFYVNLNAVKKTFGEKIKEFEKQAADALKEIERAGLPGGNSLSDMAKVAFRTLRDSDSAMLGLHFKPEGLGLVLATGFIEKSETAGLLKESRSAPLDLISEMPKGYLMYAAYHADTPGLREMQAYALGVKNKSDSPNGKAHATAVQAYLAAQPRFQSSSMELSSGGVSVTQCDKPAEAVTALLQGLTLLEAEDGYLNGMLKGPGKLTRDIANYEGFKLHQFAWEIDLDKMLEKNPQFANMPEEQKKKTKAMMEKMVGKTGRVYLGTDGKKIVQINALDLDQAKESLKNYLSGKDILGKQTGLADTKSQLAKQATGYYFIDGLQYVVEVFDMISAADNFPPGILPAGKMRVPKDKYILIGSSLTLQAEHAAVELFLPVSLVIEGRKMFEALRAPQAE